jgi:uncharacterized protein
MKPVYVVPVLDRWLLHAPHHGVTALVNRAAVASLSRHGPVEGSAQLMELRSQLASEPQQRPRPRTGPIDPRFVGLIPTRACNLRCIYCGFGAATAPCDNMDPRLAVAAVDWMAAHASASGRETLDVHFFGGEPLSAADVVDVAVHRARAAAAAGGLSPRMEIATNGVCGEERARFLGDYFDWVVLSFDGPREIHDCHRPMDVARGSFDHVARTAHTLSSSPGDLCFRICVAEDNVGQLAEIVRWFCADFRPSAIDFETLQPTPQSERAGLAPPDPYAFASEYRRARGVATEQGVEAIYTAAAAGTPRLSFCPVGSDALIVSPDGRVSACYLAEEDWKSRGLDLDVGRLQADGVMSLDMAAVERVRRLAADKPRCEGCFCRWSCAGGCHVNHFFSPGSTRYDDFCVQTRLITACSLLDETDSGKFAAELLEDAPAMRALVLRDSDCLEDWEAAGA